MFDWMVTADVMLAVCVWLDGYCWCNVGLAVCVKCGNTALHGAAWNGFSRTVNVLLCNDASVHAVNKVILNTHLQLYKALKCPVLAIQ